VAASVSLTNLLLPTPLQTEGINGMLESDVIDLLKQILLSQPEGHTLPLWDQNVAAGVATARRQALRLSLKLAMTQAADTMFQQDFIECNPLAVARDIEERQLAAATVALVEGPRILEDMSWVMDESASPESSETLNRSVLPLVIAVEQLARGEEATLTAAETLLAIDSIALQERGKLLLTASGAVPLLLRLIEPLTEHKKRTVTSRICLLAELGTQSLLRMGFNRQCELLLSRDLSAARILEKVAELPPLFTGSGFLRCRRHARQLLWQIRDQYKFYVEPSQGVDLDRVFLSYGWAEQLAALELRASLIEAGFSVCIDVNDGFTGAAHRAEQLVNCLAVVVCVSRSYKHDTSARFDIQSAEQAGTRINPVLVEQDYVADGWLGVACRSRTLHDYTADPSAATAALISELYTAQKTSAVDDV